MAGLYTLALSGFEECDANILMAAITEYVPEISVVSETQDNNIDFVICANDIPPFPTRIGAILDHIETMMFQAYNGHIFSYGAYRLDWSKNSLTISDHDSPITLSDRERDLITFFIQCGDNGCSKTMLLNKIWGYRADLETHALETQIYRLRQKIEQEPDTPKRLITIDSGYKLA